MQPLRLEVIIGSIRPERAGGRVAEWFTALARADAAFDIDVLDLREFPEATDATLSADTSRFRARLAAADAFVAVTPEYNHGYGGALKSAFDNAKREWRAKPIGFVSYGGLSRGLRAVEQLRQVVAELHMVSVRESVSIPRVGKAFDESGNVRDGAAVDAVPRMLRQLEWWGTGLRGARAGAGYPE